MKKTTIFLTLAISIIAMSAVAQVTGSFTDSRDGKTYKTIKIGEQTWMAENLAYKANEGCWAYNNNKSNVAAYGYLYNWETAKNVCPSGWHLPTNDEWIELITYLGDVESSGKKMKSITGWNENGNGNNKSGFAGLPGGSHSRNGAFSSFGKEGYWCSSTKNQYADGWYCVLEYNSYKANTGFDSETDGVSIRCLKN